MGAADEDEASPPSFGDALALLAAAHQRELARAAADASAAVTGRPRPAALQAAISKELPDGSASDPSLVAVAGVFDKATTAPSSMASPSQPNIHYSLSATVVAAASGQFSTPDSEQVPPGSVLPPEPQCDPVGLPLSLAGDDEVSIPFVSEEPQTVFNSTATPSATPLAMRHRNTTSTGHTEGRASTVTTEEQTRAMTIPDGALPCFHSAKLKQSKSVIPDVPAGVEWKWEHRTGMRPYDVEVQRRIEAAFQSGESKVRLKAGLAGKKGNPTPMEVFFWDMMQCDPRTGNTRSVQRVGPDSLKDRALRLCRHAWISWKTGQPFCETCADYQHRRKKTSGTQSSNISELCGDGRMSFMHALRNRSHRVTKSVWFVAIIAAVVIFSSVWVAIEVDHNNAEMISDAPPMFQVVAHTITVVFLIELLLRWVAYPSTRDAFRSVGFRFDFVLLALLIVENWIIPVVALLSGGRVGSSSVLKMARLLKVARMVRLARMVPEVMTLLRGMAKAMKSVAVTLLVLFLLNVFFGVAIRIQFVDSVGDAKAVEEEYFPSVSSSMWTLLFQGTFLDSVNKVALACRDANKNFCVFIFLAYIFLSTFTILNILIGLVCEVISQVKAEEEMDNLHHRLKNNLEGILDAFDTDNSMALGKNEFDLMLKNPEVHQVLQEFGTSPQVLKHLAFIEYECMKHLPEEEQELSFRDILTLVVRLRGEGTARLHDIVELRTYTRHRLDKVVQSIEELKRCQSPQSRRVTLERH